MPVPIFQFLQGQKKERVGRLVRMHANHREEIKEICAGDIAAVIGLKDTTTGNTLCDEKNPVLLESIDFPEPVIKIAVEPKTKADQEKMGVALQVWPKKTRLSAWKPMRKPTRRLFPAWANCIWKLSSTA